MRGHMDVKFVSHGVLTNPTSCIRTVQPKKQPVLKGSDEGTSHSVRRVVFGTDHNVPNVQWQRQL